MKIAFLMPPTITGRQNGVVSQALTWKACLEKQGVVVDLTSPWETYQWDQYDAIHVFVMNHYLDILPALKQRGARRIVFSPIYDSNRHTFFENLLSRIRFPVGSLSTTWASVRSCVPYVDTFLVRSDFEAQKIASVFDIQPTKIITAPLPVRFKSTKPKTPITREPICSHVSILSAPIKNVRRLVEAAQKYKFPLHLAGNINDAEFKHWLDEIVQNNNNIIYHGVLSDDQLVNLYRRSQVFALPSLIEGVGLVGLEAALYGADIVITDRGGPKEYYGELAFKIDPEDVDAIGAAVKSFLDGTTFQPKLADRIATNYSLEASANKLMEIYGEAS